MQSSDPMQQDMAQPSKLETDLDTIYRMLGRLNYKLEQIPMLDHLTQSEQRNLEDALSRTQHKLTELADKIHGTA